MAEAGTMKNTKCYLCQGKTLTQVKGSVRDMPDLKILKCDSCGLVFLESFDHIDENYYESSNMFIKDKDTKEEPHLSENEMDNARRFKLLKKMASGKRVMDFGCGNGGFLDKIKDSCKECAGVEKDLNYYAKFNRDKRIKIYSGLDEIKGKFDVITLFHVLEHLKDPVKVLKELALFLNKGGIIVIEIPNANDALLSIYDCDAFSKFTYWSPHLFLFDNNTLKKTIELAGLKVDKLFQIQRYTLSNHLYWLAKGKPGGHQVWSFMDSPDLNKEYEKSLSKANSCDTVIAYAKKL
jgi:cyclopropane fatty-acyl-phospholipid synthase-like methyltransferase